MAPALPFRASKRFTLFGRDIAPGEVVDVSALPPQRVHALEQSRFGLRVPLTEDLSFAPSGEALAPAPAEDLPSPGAGAGAEHEALELSEPGAGGADDATELLGIGEELEVTPAPRKKAPAKKATGRSQTARKRR